MTNVLKLFKSCFYEKNFSFEYRLSGLAGMKPFYKYFTGHPKKESVDDGNMLAVSPLNIIIIDEQHII